VLVGSDRAGGFNFSLQYALLGLGDDSIRPFTGGRGRGRGPVSGGQN
jgi:hypothetical protein